MNKAKSLTGRYRTAIIAALGLVVLIVFMPELRPKIGSSLLVLGLLDVWVPRETLMRFMGPGSGLKGLVLSFALGSAAAGPLYGAFPVAAVLMRKGASFSNILIFIGAWSTTKIPMLLFEMNALGVRFALARLAIDVPGIIIIALAIQAIVPTAEVERIYAAAATMDVPTPKKG